MKCIKCSAESPTSSKFCDYCGSTLVESTPTASTSKPSISATVDTVATSADKLSSFVSSALRIKSLSVNSFRWLPFLFNVPYLAGKGNTKEAIHTALVLLAGSALAAGLAIIGFYNLIHLIMLATFVFQLYYCYLIATRIDCLIRQDAPFNWGVSIAYLFGYAIVASILNSIITYHIGHIW